MLLGAQPFDAANARHVDLVAGGLLKQTIVHGDSESLALLVDLTQPHLEPAAEQVARDVGLAMAPDDLIVALFSMLFAETAPRLTATRHFLAWAADWMVEHAEAWIRDLSMLDTPQVGQRVLPAAPCADGSTVRTPNETEDDFYAYALKVCFHRLDVDSRRILRAFDVQDLSAPAAAQQLGLDEAVVESRLHEARRRLAVGIANVVLGPEEKLEVCTPADRKKLGNLLYEMAMACSVLIPENLDPGEVTKNPDPVKRLPLRVLAGLIADVCDRVSSGVLDRIDVPLADPAPDSAADVARTCLALLEQVEGASARRRFFEAIIAQRECDHLRVIAILEPMSSEPLPEWLWLGVRWHLTAAHLRLEQHELAARIGEASLRECPSDRTLIFNTATAYAGLQDDAAFDRTCEAFASSHPQCEDPEWWDSFLADQVPSLAEDLGRDVEDVRARLSLE